MNGNRTRLVMLKFCTLLVTRTLTATFPYVCRASEVMDRASASRAGLAVELLRLAIACLSFIGAVIPAAIKVPRDRVRD